MNGGLLFLQVEKKKKEKIEQMYRNLRGRGGGWDVRTGARGTKGNRHASRIMIANGERTVLSGHLIPIKDRICKIGFGCRGDR